MKKLLFILMVILLTGGILLLFGELETFELLTFIVVKCTAVICIYASYVIYITEFTNIKEI